MNWFEVSCVSAVLVFILIAWYIIQTLRAAKAVLSQVDHTLVQVQRQMNETGEHLHKLLRSTTAFMDEVQTELRSIQGILAALHRMGTTLEQAASSVHKASAALSNSVRNVQTAVHTHQHRVQEIIEWMTTGVGLWQRWQAHRQAKTSSSETGSSIKGVDNHG